MPDHCRQDKSERRVDRWHVDRGIGVVARFAVVGHNDRRRLVRLKNRDFFGDVVGSRADQAGCAHEYQRLRGEVDVLLVFSRVARHRFVAELAELNSDLFGCDFVRAVPNDCPVALRRSEAGSFSNRGTAFEHLTHCIREFAERRE